MATGGDGGGAMAMGGDGLHASTAPLTFAAFLDKMRQPGASDLVRAIKAFLTDMLATPPDAEADGAKVQARGACVRAAHKRAVQRASCVQCPAVV